MDRLDLRYTGLLHLDRTVELLTGRVSSPRLLLHYDVVNRPGDLFARQSKDASLDVSEMSASTYMMMLDRGDDRLVGIPVFLSRCFRHRHIYVRDDAGVRSPADLVGKRVGVPEYQMTAGLWARGALEDDYEVTPEKVTWVTGPLRTVAEQRRSEWHPPEGLRVEPAAPGLTLEQALAEGAVDGLVSVDVPAAGLEGSGISRLFPDYVGEERDYYRRTGVFPIMHLLVLRLDLYEADPSLAPELFRMFCEAKRRGRERMEYDGSLPVSLPWLADALAETDAVMGTNPFRYGLETSRPDLETMVRYARWQGIVRGSLAVEDLFAPETHDLVEAATSR